MIDSMVMMILVENEETALFCAPQAMEVISWKMTGM